MLLALSLLVLAPVLFACVFVWSLVALVTLPFGSVPVAALIDVTPDIALIAFAATFVAVVGSFVGGTPDVFHGFEGRTVSGEEYPDLQAMLTGLTAQAGVTAPELRILPASNVRSASPSGMQAPILGFVLSVPLLLLTMYVSVFFGGVSMLLYSVLGRYREFAADDGAAALTGDPATLATALERLDDATDEAPAADLRSVHGGLEPLAVVPFSADRPAIHPATERRIARLREQATQS